MEAKAVKVFKSQRAAKIAFGKAERAYEAARSARIEAHHVAVQGGVGESYAAEIAPFQAAEDAAWEAMKVIHGAAQAQGFYCYSYYLDSNATRDLIAQNID